MQNGGDITRGLCNACSQDRTGGLGRGREFGAGGERERWYECVGHAWKGVEEKRFGGCADGAHSVACVGSESLEG